MTLALYLPGLGAAPHWLRITVGVIVLGLMVARLWLFFRRRK
ncbi:hypothetical protein [Streptomyces sp. NPDC059916]